MSSSKRRLFLGDVQGCRDEFEALLEEARYDPATDRLVCVGDLVNRGPDNVGVLRLARALGLDSVLGNHDLHALPRLAGEAEAKRRDTLDDLLDAPDRGELGAWLAERPYVLSWDDVLCVHAGIHPLWRDPESILARGKDHEPSAAAVHFVTGVRFCAPDGSRPASDDPPPDSPYRPWYEYWSESVERTRTVVFGHWSQRGLVTKPRVRGLDSGCVWGGRLTAWIAEEDRLVSVPARRVYAPHEA